MEPPASSPSKLRKRTARISREEADYITQEAPDYDRAADAKVLSSQMSRRQKVQILHLLIVLGAVCYASLVSSNVSWIYLAPLKVFPIGLMCVTNASNSRPWHRAIAAVAPRCLC